MFRLSPLASRRSRPCSAPPALVDSLSPRVLLDGDGPEVTVDGDGTTFYPFCTPDNYEPVDDLSEAADHVEEIVEEAGEKIDRITIAGHGFPGGIIIGEDSVGSVDVNLHNQGRDLHPESEDPVEALDRIFEQLDDGCVVEFVTCNTGQGPMGESFVDGIEKMLEDAGVDDATVIVHETNVAWTSWGNIVEVPTKEKGGDDCDECP